MTVPECHECIERTVANVDGCCDGNKIKTHFAQIIVRGKAEKPYYEILYFDTEDRTYHIGFGSYCLDYVFKWLSEEFEIVEAEPLADVTPVRHGRWVLDEKRYVIYCSECGEVSSYSPNLRDVYEENHYCPNCGAKMDGGET